MTSLSSNSTFNVQIDSQYRDMDKYPTVTDFGVKFKNDNTGTSLNGYPIYGGKIDNSSLQIDPDYLDASFKVVNGSLKNLKRMNDGSIYISGLIDVLQLGGMFKILQDTYTVFSLSSNTIPSAFIAKFIPVGSSYYSSFFIYLTPTSSPLPSSTYRLPTTRSIFDIDVNGNVYWMFDCSFVAVNVYSSLNSTTYYTVQSEDSSSLRQYNVICAFNSDGTQYVLNGQPWGYHIISSDKDLENTLSNGKFGIKSNTALNLFYNVNINPYDPYIITSGYINASYKNNYLTTGTVGDPRTSLLIIKNSGGGQYLDYYKIGSSTNSTDITSLNFVSSSSVSALGNFIEWTASYNEYGNYVYIDGERVFAAHLVFRFDKTTGVISLVTTSFALGINFAGGNMGTRSNSVSVINGNYLYVYVANIDPLYGYQGNILRRLDLTNVAGGFSVLLFDQTVQTNGYLIFGSIISYGNYIVASDNVYDNTTSTRGICIHAYNTSTSSMLTKFFTGTINGKSISVGDYSTKLFIGVDGNLYEFIAGGNAGYLFRVNIGTTITITYIKTISDFGQVYIIPYRNGSKQYLISSANGMTYDISDMTNIYKITDSYPSNVPSGNTLNISSVFNNVLSGIYTRSSDNYNNIISGKTIDSTTNIKSSQYSKPIMSLYGEEKQYEIFTIPGSSNNLVSNFSPAQFIGSGLLGWYNAKNTSNYSLDGSNKVTRIIDLSGNGLDLVGQGSSSTLPTIDVTSSVSSFQWAVYNGQTGMFQTQQTSTAPKFVMMTFVPITSDINDPLTLIPFESTQNITFNLTKFREGSVSLSYNSGFRSTSFTGLNITTSTSSTTTPVYFGYDILDGKSPFFAAKGTGIIPTVDVADTYKYQTPTLFNVMKNLGGEFIVRLYEIIVLDFVPTEYQLSLFQSYLKGTPELFPSVLPPMAGVYSLTSPNRTNELYFNYIDGTTFASTRTSELWKLSGTGVETSLNFNDVKYYRNEYITADNYINIVITIANNNNKIRVYRFNDYLKQGFYTTYTLPTNYPRGLEGYVDANGDFYFIVSEYYGTTNATKRIWKFKLNVPNYTTTFQDSIQLVNSVDLRPDLGTSCSVTSYKPYLYPNGKVYLFLVIGASVIYDSGSATEGFRVFSVYDITTSSQIDQVYTTIAYNNFSGWYGSDSIVAYPNGNIYYMYKRNNGGGILIVWDVTIPTVPVLQPYVPSLAGLNCGSIYGLNYIDHNDLMWYSPQLTFTHPVTGKIYSVQHQSVYVGGGNVTKIYLGFKDITNMNIVPASSVVEPKGYWFRETSIPFVDFSNRSMPLYIRIAVWNQKVWCLYSIVDLLYPYPFNYPGGTVIIDISNPEYFYENYTNNLNSSLINTSLTTGIQGIGCGVIGKINNLGNQEWISYLGGNGSQMWSINNTISNIELDDTLKFMYVSGSWKYKIQGLLSNGTTMNSIISSNGDSSINSFILKLNINSGEFVWLSPTFGVNDDYFERIQYISNTYKGIGIVAHFSSPAMLVYEPQASKTGGTYTNPLNTILNVGNSSTITSALIVINENGGLQWHSKLYSTEQNRDILLYDLSVSGNQINCIGISNANVLQCTDSTLKNVQDMYTQIDPLKYNYIIVYGFDLNGNYLKSERVEVDGGINISVEDIKAFSVLNRIVFFINCYTDVDSSSFPQPISFYPCNKDGTYAASVSVKDVNTNLSYIFTYKYDSSFTDTNGKKYSVVTMINNNITESLYNYKLFISGGVQVSDYNTITTTTLNSETVLNRNYSIRSNAPVKITTVNNNITTISYNTLITLNSLIDTSKIVRNNLPFYNLYWLGSISRTPLFGGFIFNTQISNSVLTVAEFFCDTPTPVSSTGTYYVYYQTTLGGGFVIIPVSSISVYRGLYTITLTSPIDSSTSATPGLAYLTTVNRNADYTLQFYPGSINAPVYFNVVLNSITIPNRPVKSYDYSGVRYLSDFPYIYLAIVNADDSDNIDPNIFNNFYTNNIDRTQPAIFTLPSNTLSGGSNFAVLTSSYVPKIKFSPGFYNIRIRLYDPDGNIISYDNTPTLSSDSSFTGGTVPDKLMRITLAVTFKTA